MGGIAKDIASIFAIIATVFIFLSALMVKYSTGVFMFKWSIVKSILTDNMAFLVLILLLVLTGAIVVIVAIVHHFKRLMKERRNCQVQYVELAHIASIWLSHEEAVTNIRDIVETEKAIVVSSDSTADSIKSLQEYILEVQGSAIIEFVKTCVLPNEPSFSDYEIKIIFELLDLLQKEGNIPSVATLYNSDAEKLAYSKQIVTLSGKTCYEILKEFTLLDHTLRVSKAIIKLNEEKSDSLRRESLYGRLIIAALGHDIGKIYIKDQLLKITGEMYYKTSHENISAMILQEKYPDYAHIGTVISAIKGHHIPKPDGSLAPLLKEADKKARGDEVEIWLVKNKEATVESVELDGFYQIQKTTPDIDPLAIEQVNLVQDNNNNEIEVITTNTTSGDIAFEFEHGKDMDLEKKEVETKSKKKIKKDPTTQEGDELGYDFLDVYGEFFIKALHHAANTTHDKEPIQGERIISISVTDLVLYEYMEFKKILEKTMQKRIDTKNLLMIMKQLKDRKFIDLIDVENGYLVSRFTIETGRGTKEMTVVPVFCKMIGYTPNETEELKREHHKLRGITVHFGKGVGR